MEKIEETIEPLLHITATILEDNFDETPVNLLIYSSKDLHEINFNLRNRKENYRKGSCFALLRSLVKSSHSAMPLTKEALLAILSR